MKTTINYLLGVLFGLNIGLFLKNGYKPEYLFVCVISIYVLIVLNSKKQPNK